jgi:hypothetical protein
MKLATICITTATLLGLGGVANGIFMLLSPADWYFAVPGVTTTGPFNQHFIRDIGLIFMLLGAALLVGVVRPALRVPFWGMAAIWLSGHALFHAWEVAVGICGTDAIAQDFPAVTLPAILTVLLTIWAASQTRSASSAV